MKLIEQSAQLLPLGSINEQIELAARTCYKSEDKITEDSSEKFVKRLIDNNHTAMLEHGTVHLTFPQFDDRILKYRNNQYSSINNWCVTTNYRVIVENGWEDDLQFQCDLTEQHPERYSVKITTSIAIARELCRHRHFSFAQESTRYCNYSKDKFNNELTFIRPGWCVVNDCSYFINKEGITEGDGYLGLDKTSAENTFINNLIRAESDYMWLLERGLKPQEAREILPLSLKTELVMTGFDNDWEHFFSLRLDESTGKVHPDMKKLAQLIHIELYGDSNNIN